MAVDKEALQAAQDAKDVAIQLYEEAIQNCVEARDEADQNYESGVIDAMSYKALLDAIDQNKRLAKSEKDAAMRAFRKAVQLANSKGGGKKKAAAEAEPTA